MFLSQQNIIFVDENIPLLPKALEPCGIVHKFSGRKLRNVDLRESACSALFIRSTSKANRELLHDTQVKFVGTATSGIDHINTNYLEQNNIFFAYAPGSNANSVAEYVVYSMLCWAGMLETSLKGKTIGIIGYGNIGKIVARYAQNLGMKVLVNDPPLRKDGYTFPDFVDYMELKDLCEETEIITNHIPYTEDVDFPTYQLLDANIISGIRQNALFLNTSRGGIVDEESLFQRLTQGSFYAVIDVWEDEPLINKDLAKLALLATQHIAGYSRDGKLRGALQLAQQYEKFSGSKTDLTAINKELSQYSPMPQENFKDEKEILRILKEKRCLHDDHREFIASLELPDKERAAQFDLLRKNYPERRESL